MKRIMIVGAGYGGIRAALRLHKELRKHDVEITLINRNEFHTLLTELHEVAGNRVDDDSVLIPLHRIFQYTKVKIIRDNITEVRTSENKVIGEACEYAYDYLILAGGSCPTYFGIPGIEEHAFSLWSHADAVKLREHIRAMFAKAASTQDPDERKKLLTFVVCGGGFTGVEMVGELVRWKNELAREHGIDRKEVSLILVEALDKCLTVLPDRLSKKATDYMRRLGIEVRLNSPIVGVTPENVALRDGTIIPTCTAIWCGGVQGCELSGATGLPTVDRGRLVVNEYQQTSVPNVYAIGDQANGQPALVEAALQTAETAAHNIAAEIKGKAKKPHKPNLHGVMVSIGRWWGVANLMGIQLSGFMAIVMKHLVNLHYLFDIGGFELCLRYIRHEFYREEMPRNIVEQQFVRRGQLFWLTPIRLYLGYMWFMQGLKKLQGGWWNQVILKAKEVAAAAAGAATLASQAAEAVTSATPGSSGAAGTAADAGMSLISAHTPAWYAWIVETFIYPNAIFFQRAIVATELILGVLFALGAFTFIAAVVSVVMNINFILSTGVYDYWYLFASIAMMAGAGHAFGADQIIMPYLMRQWRYLVRNRGIRIWLWR